MRIALLVAAAVLAFSGPALAQTVLAQPGGNLPPPQITLPAPAPVVPIAGANAAPPAWVDGNGFITAIGDKSAVWATNSTMLMRTLAWLIIGVAVAFMIGRNILENHGTAGVIWALPQILWSLLPAFIWLGVAPVFVNNLLTIGLGAGSYVSGTTGIESVNSLALAFWDIMKALWASPFVAYSNLQTYFLATVTHPGILGLLGLEEAVAIVLSFFVLVVGAADVLMLAFVQISALIVGPLTLLFVPFSALRSTEGLWHGAVQVWMKQVFRLISAVVISSLTLNILQGFATKLAAISAADPEVTFQAVIGSMFWIVFGVIVIGSLTAWLPFAIDAAFNGNMATTGPSPMRAAQQMQRAATNAALSAVTKITAKHGGGKRP